MQQNLDRNYKPTLKKCGVDWDWGIGTIDKTPSQVSIDELYYRRNINWIWFEGYWYIVKNDRVVDEEIEEYIGNSYSKEQVISKIIELVEP